LFVFIALPIVPGLPAWLRDTVIVASLAFLGALIAFLIVASRPAASRTLFKWLTNRFTPVNLQAKLLVLLDRFMDGLSSLTSFRNIIMVFFTSVIVWLLETVKYWFVMIAFNFSVSFFVLMLMNGVVNLATTLPSAPGYIGTFDGPGIETLKVFGVDPTLAAAYTLVLHAALWLPITLLGFWYMAYESFNWRDFDQAIEQASPDAGVETAVTEGELAQLPPAPASGN
jgi:uncharacterized protein (TIRG00374 family)